ncbi:MAG: hypothetical protein GX077_00735 [Tissierellia bacterium]|nr:hypothetical protein [Tissierellia bacterium]
MARMHGSAVVSIAVGKNVGVAPEADLYYIAADFYRNDLYWVAEAIDRIMEIIRHCQRIKRYMLFQFLWD